MKPPLGFHNQLRCPGDRAQRKSCPAGGMMRRITTIAAIAFLLAQPATAQPKKRLSISLAPLSSLQHTPPPVSGGSPAAGRGDLRNLAGSTYPTSHYQKGMYLRQKGEIEAALVEFLKATQENPTLVKAFYEQALIFRDRGYFKLAESSLQQALAVKPDYQQARVLLAAVRLELGNIGGAVQELSRSLGIGVGANPQPPEPAGSPAGGGAEPASRLETPPSVLQMLHSLLPEPQEPEPAAPQPARSAGQPDEAQAPASLPGRSVGQETDRANAQPEPPALGLEPAAGADGPQAAFQSSQAAAESRTEAARPFGEILPAERRPSQPGSGAGSDLASRLLTPLNSLKAALLKPAQLIAGAGMHFSLPNPFSFLKSDAEAGRKPGGEPGQRSRAVKEDLLAAGADPQTAAPPELPLNEPPPQPEGDQAANPEQRSSELPAEPAAAISRRLANVLRRGGNEGRRSWSAADLTTAVRAAGQSAPKAEAGSPPITMVVRQPPAEHTRPAEGTVGQPASPDSPRLNTALPAPIMCPVPAHEEPPLEQSSTQTASAPPSPIAWLSFLTPPVSGKAAPPAPAPAAGSQPDFPALRSGSSTVAAGPEISQVPASNQPVTAALSSTDAGNTPVPSADVSGSVEPTSAPLPSTVSRRASLPESRPVAVVASSAIPSPTPAAPARPPALPVPTPSAPAKHPASGVRLPVVHIRWPSLSVNWPTQPAPPPAVVSRAQAAPAPKQLAQVVNRPAPLPSAPTASPLPLAAAPTPSTGLPGLSARSQASPVASLPAAAAGHFTAAAPSPAELLAPQVVSNPAAPAPSPSLVVRSPSASAPPPSAIDRARCLPQSWPTAVVASGSAPLPTPSCPIAKPLPPAPQPKAPAKAAATPLALPTLSIQLPSVSVEWPEAPLPVPGKPTRPRSAPAPSRAAVSGSPPAPPPLARIAQQIVSTFAPSPSAPVQPAAGSGQSARIVVPSPSVPPAVTTLSAPAPTMALGSQYEPSPTVPSAAPSQAPLPSTLATQRSLPQSWPTAVVAPPAVASGAEPLPSAKVKLQFTPDRAEGPAPQAQASPLAAASLTPSASTAQAATWPGGQGRTGPDSGQQAFSKQLLPGSQSRLLALAHGNQLANGPTRQSPALQSQDSDPWTAKLKDLQQHGTANLKNGEAFMFSEQTGEAVLFLPDGQTIRRKIAPSQDAEAVARLRRPDIFVPQDLQYNLSLLAKLLPRQDNKSAAGPPPQNNNFTVNDLLNQSQGFLGWLKQLMKF